MNPESCEFMHLTVPLASYSMGTSWIWVAAARCDVGSVKRHLSHPGVRPAWYIALSKSGLSKHIAGAIKDQWYLQRHRWLNTAHAFSQALSLTKSTISPRIQESQVLPILNLISSLHPANNTRFTMHRTDTTDFTTFNLPFPDGATFTFTSSPDTIRITILPSGSWFMPLHWHPSENRAAGTVSACESVSCLSGTLHVYVSQGTFLNYDKIGSTGMSMRFAPGQRVSWNRLRIDAQVPLMVDLVANHTLWRNVCSTILDKDIFPQLASTPSWLKALFTILAVIPSWRNALLNMMLWIQLQTVFLTHDVHVYYGYIPVTWPWTTQPFGGRPPIWATRLKIQSVYFIAKAVMTTAYWTGTLFLGMKGEYIEYTPSRGHRDEKH